VFDRYCPPLFGSSGRPAAGQLEGPKGRAEFGKSGGKGEKSPLILRGSLWWCRMVDVRRRLGPLLKMVQRRRS